MRTRESGRIDYKVKTRCRTCESLRTL